MTMTTKAVFKGIVTRTALLNNIAPDDDQGDGAVQSAIAKVYSIKGLSSGKELTDAQLAKINSYAIVPLKKEEVHYVQLLMAHNGIDRDVERFNEDLLADFSRTLPGKGFFVEGHPGGWNGHGGPGEGLHFDCRVAQMTPEEFMAKTNEAIKLPEGVTMVSALMSDAYILALDSNSDTRKKMNAGIIRFSSIGFKAPFYSITDDNGNHIYGEYRPKGEALEGSLVWLGAQPGAGVMKSAKGAPQQQPEDISKKGEQKTMDKVIAMLGAKFGRTFKADTLAQDIILLVGEKDTEISRLTTENTGMKAAAIDGAAYRKSLIEDMIKAGVLLEEIKTDEVSQKAETDYLMTVPIDRLKTMSEKAMTAARKKFPEKFQLPAPDQSQRDQDGKDASAAAVTAGGTNAGAGKPSLSEEAKKRAEAGGRK